MDVLFKILPILIGILTLSCTTDTIVDRVDNYPVNECEVTADTTAIYEADSVSVKTTDTTDKRQPIGFTVTVKDWEYADN